MVKINNNTNVTFISKSEYIKAILRAPVYEVAKVTPLQIMKKISSRLNNTILVKREDQQLVHSFKLRGAYSMISDIYKNNKLKKSGIITASAGNHAQGVALSGQRLCIPTLIIMPLTTSDIKIDAVKALGSKIMLYGANFDEAQSKAIEISKLKNMVFIPPFDHPSIIAGQGTVGMELLQQDINLDRIFIPIGGGGLAAGISILIKQLMPQISIIGVEAEESACFKAALNAGKPIELSHVGLFAEGVAVRRIGTENFRLCKKYLDDIITVDSDAICSAIKDLFEDVRAIAEPSGALSLAGLKKYIKYNNIKGERLVHILSGANLNFHSLRYISERCELGEQLEALLAVTIPECKGSFLKFCKLLNNKYITEFNYRYSNSDNACIFVGIRLTKGIIERKKIILSLCHSGYHVIDLSDDEMSKLHVRYMVGGRPSKNLNEKLYSFEFPEYPGALLKFLQNLGTDYNISLFHYRSHGTDFGRVIAGFNFNKINDTFSKRLIKLGYICNDESNNPAFNLFLKNIS